MDRSQSSTTRSHLSRSAFHIVVVHPTSTIIIFPCYVQGPVSQRVTINRRIDINRSSVANCVLRKLAINRNPL